jgi:[ribosomal protein S5]-alanine N-acetyltransferase
VNRAHFSAFISDSGVDFYARFTVRHSASLAERAAGIGAFYVLVAGDCSVLGRFNLVFAGNGARRRPHDSYEPLLARRASETGHQDDVV